MRLALDADVCIYSVTQTPWTEPVRQFMAGADLVGSVLLVVELLPKPMRLGAGQEEAALRSLLRRMTLVDVSVEIAALATQLAAEHRLRAIDAIHFATALKARAEVFLTNNTKHFPPMVDGLVVRHPDRP